MAKPEKEEAETEREGAPDGPLLDLSDDAVKKMIKAAKKRGYVTYTELNAVLPSEETDPDRIEDIQAMLSDMGINVIEADDDTDEGEPEAQPDGEEEANELAEQTGTAVASVAKKEPTDRTDDPVRMYLREMGSVELLSREGEIAIAKRIEAGRETMIEGLCESPLTFQAIIGIKVKTVGQGRIQELFAVLEMVNVRHRQDARAGAGKNIRDLAVNVFKLAPQLVEDRPVILAQRRVAVRQPGGVFQRTRNVNNNALPAQLAFDHGLPVSGEPLVARPFRPGVFKPLRLLLEPE